MKVLVFNCGSSSVKFQLIDREPGTALARGAVERIGSANGLLRYQLAGRAWIDREVSVTDHRAGIGVALEALTDPSFGAIRDLRAIAAVGHRIVHGGSDIHDAVIIDPGIVALVEHYARLAPLHNPPALMGYRAAADLLPAVPHIAVFDTAFYADLEPRVHVYPIAWEYYERHGIRRFGYHGTSHKYVSQRAAAALGRQPGDFRCITCHLGNGCSIAAVRNGRPVDTSLGFGTMCGLMMGTRAGDVDPEAVLYLIERLGMSSAEVRRMLYQESGLKGISGLSNDMRDIERAADTGNARARLALEMFVHSAARHAAGLATSLGGPLDALVFTAGIGENSPRVRELVCGQLSLLGVAVDPVRNQVRGREAIVSPAGARAAVLVVPTNEELMIAIETAEAVRRAQGTNGESRS